MRVRGRHRRWKDLWPAAQRTIDNLVKPAQPAGPRSPWWTLDEKSASDAAHVLPVLADLIESSEGRLNRLEAPVAEAISMIVRAAPDISARNARRMAWRYVLAIEAQEPTTDVEIFLAFAPWRGAEAATRYLKAFQAGWIATHFHPDANVMMRNEP